MDNIEKMIKQHGVPDEFKIEAKGWPDEKKVADELTQMNEMIAKSSETGQKVEVTKDYLKNFAKIATHVWRIKKRIYDADGKPIDTYDKLRRSIEGIEQGLESLHVEIKDHTGDIYDPGMPVNPQSFESMAGVNRDTIKETLIPTIYWNKQIVQQAEVIVGQPESRKDSESKGNNEKEVESDNMNNSSSTAEGVEQKNTTNKEKEE
mgnify:CR=1 FL=1